MIGKLFLEDALMQLNKHKQLTHYAYHVGQIVFLARHFAGNNWKSLSIPKGMSKEYEAAKNGITYKPEN